MSSSIPIVKLSFGRAFLSSSYTPLTIAGVKSFEESPYRPPTIVMPLSDRASLTSIQRGSQIAAGSLQRSSTAILLTVAGRVFRKRDMSKGRKSRTMRSPTFSPFCISLSTVSRATAAPEPIMIITLSASSAP